MAVRWRAVQEGACSSIMLQCDEVTGEQGAVLAMEGDLREGEVKLCRALQWANRIPWIWPPEPPHRGLSSQSLIPPGFPGPQVLMAGQASGTASDKRHMQGQRGPPGLGGL